MVEIFLTRNFFPAYTFFRSYITETNRSQVLKMGFFLFFGKNIGKFYKLLLVLFDGKYPDRNLKIPSVPTLTGLDWRVRGPL